MSEWNDVNLGEYVNVINGFAFKSSNFLDTATPDTLPIIKIKNVANGNVHLNGAQHHIYEVAFSKYLVEHKDVLIALTGNHPQAESQVVGIASRYKLKEKALLNQRVAKIVTKNENLLVQDFIYYFLIDSNTHQYLASQSSGSANQANISKTDIEQIQISLPCPEEQKAIASILSSLDDKIDLLHRQNTTLERMAETLFRQWFVEEAQEDWQRERIGDVLTTVLGGTPSTTKPEYWNGTVPWINSGEINKFRILEATKFISELGLKKSNAKLLPVGSTVVAITGATLGQVSLLEIETCANQSVIGIIPSERLPKEYVFLWIKLKIEEIILNETGGAQPHINKNDINNTEILIPPTDLLHEKNKIFEAWFNKITSNVFQIQTLEKLRDNLLPKLMSGEVRVKMEGASA